jgi:hypothetical protein
MKRAIITSFLLVLALALAAAAQDKSPRFTVTTLDGKQTTFSLDQLKQMPKQTVTVNDPKTKAPQAYDGVLLSSLLAAAGAPTGRTLHGKELRDYAVVAGSDGYMVVFSLFELDPPSHSNRVIVAYAVDGKPLEGNNGPLKLIAPEDQRPERWVRMLTGVTLGQVRSLGADDHTTTTRQP